MISCDTQPFFFSFSGRSLIVNRSQLDLIHLNNLSYDIASGSEITPCNKIDKPLVVYRFTGNVLNVAHIMTKL